MVTNGDLRVTIPAARLALDSSAVLRVGVDLGGPPPGMDALVAGASVQVPFPKELWAACPGFYLALGNFDLAEGSPEAHVRIYVNCTPAGALRFVRLITTAFNRSGTPFRLKALADASQYGRCDAVVLYIRQADYSSVAVLLGRLYREFAPGLMQGVPAFTKRLAPGLALAEDPVSRRSFGLHRCGLLAGGLIQAWEQSETSVEGRVGVVLNRFERDGVDPNQPFLNPGSADVYDFRWQPAANDRPQHVRTSPGSLLEEALAIGRRLTRDALSYDGRCVWLAALDNQPADHGHGQKQSPLGPDLYAGASGVALFLAELYRATGDAVLRQTSVAAIRAALDGMRKVPPRRRLALYTGWIGIVFAAVRIGLLLGEERLLGQALRMLRSCESARSTENDLLSGRAGTVLGLVLLHGMLGDGRLLEWASRQGEQLLRAAARSRAGYSWPSPWLSSRRHLTGFSHGAAGVAFALLELFQATGDIRYRQAAEAALDYERSWFDKDAGNWPDFRQTRQGPRGHGPFFAATWCHGAPGIALSRMRAYQVLRDQRLKSEAITALETTRSAIAAMQWSGDAGFSLCHGLAGNADVLLCGSKVFGLRWAEVVAREVAWWGSQAYEAKLGWRGHEPPGLMTGLAGIGHYYLRASGQPIPSVLTLRALTEAEAGAKGSVLPGQGACDV